MIQATNWAILFNWYLNRFKSYWTISLGWHISEVYERHFGPLTGLDCHRSSSKMDFSHLFLTSSFDWTVKLWSSKKFTPLYRYFFDLFENFLFGIFFLNFLATVFWRYSKVRNKRNATFINFGKISRGYALIWRGYAY